MSDTGRWRPSSRSRSRSRSRDRRSRYRTRSRSHSRDRYCRRAPPHHGHRSTSHSRSPPPSHYRRRRSPSPPRGRQDDTPPQIGTILQGRIVSVRPFGAFVELYRFRRQALIHSSQISEDVHFGRDDDDEMKMKALEYFCPKGEQFWVKITDIKKEGRDYKIACSMRAVDQNDGTDLDPQNLLVGQDTRSRGGPGGTAGRGGTTDAVPELYSIHPGIIQSVRPFGVFVQMDGYRKYGLVHFTQISDHLRFAQGDDDAERVAAISEVAGAVGERVWVKVVEIGEDEQRGGAKIGCSMKLASQRDGTDLDPGNVKFKPRGEGGGAGGSRGQAPIGASAGETRDGAVVEWGHLTADVVNYGGGTKQYEILADDDEMVMAQNGQSGGGGGPRSNAGGGSSLPPM